MQIKLIKPSRRTFLSLAVFLTLAPVGAGVHHLLTPDDSRPAATINDLLPFYEAILWSNRDPEFQQVNAALEVTSKSRTRFTGNFLVEEGKGVQTIPVRGGVSNSGRVAMNGAVNQQGFRLRVNLTGQLNATGEVIMGTYNVSGRGEGGPINDRGTIIFIVD